MRHFILFLVFVFAALLSFLHLKGSRLQTAATQRSLKVFASSSFIAKWGPGPQIKENFETICGCTVEYFDTADTTLLLQKLKAGGAGFADVILGLDQFDLERSEKEVAWRKWETSAHEKLTTGFYDELKPYTGNTGFVPYDWGILSFVIRRSEVTTLPHSLGDFLATHWKNQIALQDPRTSTLGFQFLQWLIQSQGEKQAFDSLPNWNRQIHSYSSGWSTAYGLFQKKQTQTAFSYTTSPLYHLIEEKNPDYVAVSLDEGHPVQVEYVGIPQNCLECDQAERFVRYLVSKTGQKIVMEKNYMLPVLKGVVNGTEFAQMPNYKILNIPVPNIEARERILKQWSDSRRKE